MGWGGVLRGFQISTGLELVSYRGAKAEAWGFNMSMAGAENMVELGYEQHK